MGFSADFQRRGKDGDNTLEEEEDEKTIKFLCMTVWLWRLGLEDRLQSRCLYEASFVGRHGVHPEPQRIKGPDCGSMLGWNGVNGKMNRGSGQKMGERDLQSIKVWTGGH